MKLVSKILFIVLASISNIDSYAAADIGMTSSTLHNLELLSATSPSNLAFLARQRILIAWSRHRSALRRSYNAKRTIAYLFFLQLNAWQETYRLNPTRVNLAMLKKAQKNYAEQVKISADALALWIEAKNKTEHYSREGLLHPHSQKIDSRFREDDEKRETSPMPDVPPDTSAPKGRPT